MVKMLVLGAIVALAAQDAQEDPWAEMEKNRREIDALTLINSLGLERDVLRQIAEIAGGAVEIILEGRDEVSEEIAEIVGLQKEVREALVKGEEPPAAALERIRELNEELQPVFRAEGEVRIEAGGEIRKLLSDDQVKFLRRRSGRGPSRQVRRMMEHMLRAAREVPDEAFDGMLPQRIREMVGRMMGGEEGVDEEVERIMGILQEARDMEEDEFAKERGKLLERITGEGKLAEALDRAGAGGGPEGGDDPDARLAAETFVSPRMVALLKERAGKEEEEEEGEGEEKGE
ncbi:MAG: hypothetical protein ACYTAF_07410 [Planctomycetota bacterium]|jgi:hypothetical protein